MHPLDDVARTPETMQRTIKPLETDPGVLEKQYLAAVADATGITAAFIRGVSFVLSGTAAVVTRALLLRG